MGCPSAVAEAWQQQPCFHLNVRGVLWKERENVNSASDGLKQINYSSFIRRVQQRKHWRRSRGGEEERSEGKRRTNRSFALISISHAWRCQTNVCLPYRSNVSVWVWLWTTSETGTNVALLTEHLPAVTSDLSVQVLPDVGVLSACSAGWPWSAALIRLSGYAALIWLCRCDECVSNQTSELTRIITPTGPALSSLRTTSINLIYSLHLFKFSLSASLYQSSTVCLHPTTTTTSTPTPSPVSHSLFITHSLS